MILHSQNSPMNRIHSNDGLTLFEIIMAVAITAVLAGIAIPSYLAYSDRATFAKAKSDLVRIEAALTEYMQRMDVFPPTLEDVGFSGLKDPWGNPYEYWPITGDPNQKVRKDRNLHPINTDFDLYSKGKDGKTALPLTAQASHDDIIRANNGDYLGLASNY